jgi:predicted nucleic acid-binding Zn ribbon protein
VARRAWSRPAATARLPEADRQLLAQLAARVVAAEADRRGIDLRSSAAG